MTSTPFDLPSTVGVMATVWHEVESTPPCSRERLRTEKLPVCVQTMECPPHTCNCTWLLTSPGPFAPLTPANFDTIMN